MRRGWIMNYARPDRFPVGWRRIALPTPPIATVVHDHARLQVYAPMARFNSVSPAGQKIGSARVALRWTTLVHATRKFPNCQGQV
jgi:hypothetical protein